MDNLENIDLIYKKTSINPIYNVNEGITDLDSIYKYNNGLLINFLTYKGTYLSYYVKYYTELNKIFFQLFNFPNILTINNMDIIDQSLTSYIIQKSLYNNIPVLFNNLESFLSTKFGAINNLLYKVIQKDSFGNFPSLIFPLLSDQITTILKNDINWHITYKVPIIVPWSTMSPYIAYKKYVLDISLQESSYIINLGPCHLDELSSYIQYCKSRKLYNIHQSDTSKFLNYSYNNNDVIFSNYLFNYKSTSDVSNTYYVDLSNTYIIYLGIYNNYGWNDPLKFFQTYGKTLKTYINNQSGTFDLCLNYINSSSDVSCNPNIIMINIPLFDSSYDKINQIYGNSVNKSMDKLYNIVTQDLSNVDLSNNINIFIRNFGKQSDLKVLKSLYQPSFHSFIPITCGSYYDFLEENFNDSFFSDKSIFDGLLSIQSANISNVNNLNFMKEKLFFYKNRLNDDISSGYFDNLNFDQKLYQNTMINLLQQMILINNIQVDNGILANNNSDKFIYKIFSGNELFNTSLNFDYNNFIKTYGGNPDGYLSDNFILNGLIGIPYNNNNFWNNNNGYPFNRNTFYTMCKRKYHYYDPISLESPKIDLSINFNWATIYSHFVYSEEGSNIYFSSDINLVNSIIFLCNNDLINSQIYYDKYINDIS